jgi:hypothetical protein
LSILINNSIFVHYYRLFGKKRTLAHIACQQ